MTKKCPTCGANVSAALTTCDVCGNPMQAPQSGFGGGAVPQTGFGGGSTQQSGFGPAAQPSGFGQSAGFGQPASPAGFGSQPAQGGFGSQPAQGGGFGQPAQPAQSTGFGQTAQATGFGQPATQPAGFGETKADGGFGGPPHVESSGFGGGAFPNPPSYDAKPKKGIQGGMSPEAARFADTVNAQSGVADTQWSFKQCLVFLLKMLIPIYGLVVLITCAVGNPKKYPATITNYVRASLVVGLIIMVLSIVLSLALGATVASMLM